MRDEDGAMAPAGGWELAAKGMRALVIGLGEEVARLVVVMDRLVEDRDLVGAKAAVEQAAQKEATTRQATETMAAEKEAAEEKAAERMAAERLAAEQKAAEQKAAEQKAAEKKAAEQKAAEQGAADLLQRWTEEKAAVRAEAKRLAAAAKAAEERERCLADFRAKYPTAYNIEGSRLDRSSLQQIQARLKYLEKDEEKTVMTYAEGTKKTEFSTGQVLTEYHLIDNYILILAFHKTILHGLVPCFLL